METKNQQLLVQMLSKSIIVRMSTLRILARQVYYFTKKYCLLSYVDAECPPDIMNSFISELEIIYGGAFNLDNIAADLPLDYIKDSLNVEVPQLMASLQNNQMQENLDRINSLQWRDLFDIGVVVTENRETPSPTDSASR